MSVNECSRVWNAEHLLRKLEIAGVNRSVDCGNEMARVRDFLYSKDQVRDCMNQVRDVTD